MAIEVNVIIPNLKMNETHTSTKIQISDNEDFTGTLEIDDELILPNSLTHKTYDKELVPNKQYFIKVRAILTPGGYQGISKTTSFIAKDTNDIALHINPPALVNPPSLEIIGGREDVGLTELVFKQTTNVAENHTISATSWILTDSHNVVRFSSIEDSTNIHSIAVDTTLKQKETYIMRCCVTLDTGSTSMYSSLTFTTGSIVDGGLKFDDTRGEINNKNIIHPSNAFLLPLPNSVSKDITIMKRGTSIKELAITGDEIQLTPETKDYYSYVIKAKAIMQDGSTLGPIYRYVYRTEEVSVGGYPKQLPVEGE